MSRVAFSLFGLNIYWYGIIIAAGLLLAVVLMFAREKKLGLYRDISVDLLLVTIPVALVCARVYFVAFSWDMFKDDLLSVFAVRSGGMAIYGGIIGGFFTILIFSRVKKISLWKLLDLGAPSLALGQAVGRWGNFANAEAYGRATAAAWQRFFPFAVYIEADGLWHYATFFYESVWCFLIVAVTLVAERKKAFKRSGDVFWWYLALYGAERAFVEGLRIDSLYLMGARVSQLLSAALLAVAIVCFCLRAMKADRRKGVCLIGAAAALVAPWFGAGFVTAALLAVSLALALIAYRAIPAAKPEGTI